MDLFGALLVLALSAWAYRRGKRTGSRAGYAAGRRRRERQGTRSARSRPAGWLRELFFCYQPVDQFLSAASLIRSGKKFSGIEGLLLRHAPDTDTDRHYVQAPQQTLDEAIAWLGRQDCVLLGLRPKFPPSSVERDACNAIARPDEQAIADNRRMREQSGFVGKHFPTRDAFPLVGMSVD